MVAFLCCPLVVEFSVGKGFFVIRLSKISFILSLFDVRYPYFSLMVVCYDSTCVIITPHASGCISFVISLSDEKLIYKVIKDAYFDIINEDMLDYTYKCISFVLIYDKYLRSVHVSKHICVFTAHVT